MDCSDFTFPPDTRSLREQMRDLGGDEYVALDVLRERKVILASQGFVGRTALFEMYCKGWLLRVEFDDKDAAYKAKPEIMIEFEQMLTEFAREFYNKPRE